MSKREIAGAAIGFALMLLPSVGAQAVEVRIIAGAAFAPALAELGPQFERDTGHKLVVKYGIAGTINQILDAEAFDLAITSPASLDAATKRGKIAAAAPTTIARVGMAVGVRSGTAKPDISSVNAFKQALLNSKSVTFPPKGRVGIHLGKVFSDLGIADQMKDKIRPQQTVERVPLAVAAGEAELGFAPATVLLSASGVQVVGPFPAEIQNYIVYATGIGSAATQRDAAILLINYMTSPSATASLKAKGFEPITPQSRR
jgi:molybdate transport system substrate-binding protein